MSPNNWRSYTDTSANGTRLLSLLKHLVVRHMKDQVLGEQAVLQLPPKTQADVPGE